MNISLFYFLHNILLNNAWLGPFVWFFAVPLIYIVIVFLAVYFFIHYDLFHVRNIQELLKGKGRDMVRIFFSGGFAYVVASLLKIVIQTPRPFVALADVHPLFLESAYAFPSGHSATIAALAGALLFTHKKVGIVCVIVAVFIGLARVVAGVHFPVDIIGGYAIGFLVAFFVKSL